MDFPMKISPPPGDVTGDHTAQDERAALFAHFTKKKVANIPKRDKKGTS